VSVLTEQPNPIPPLFEEGELRIFSYKTILRSLHLGVWPEDGIESDLLLLEKNQYDSFSVARALTLEGRNKYWQWGLLTYGPEAYAHMDAVLMYEGLAPPQRPEWSGDPHSLTMKQHIEDWRTKHLLEVLFQKNIQDPIAVKDDHSRFFYNLQNSDWSRIYKEKWDIFDSIPRPFSYKNLLTAEYPWNLLPTILNALKGLPLFGPSIRKIGFCTTEDGHLTEPQQEALKHWLTNHLVFLHGRKSLTTPLKVSQAENVREQYLQIFKESDAAVEVIQQEAPAFLPHYRQILMETLDLLGRMATK
jgi:hypothetical protein